MSQLFKKIIIIFSTVVFILFVALMVGGWLLGAFSTVTLAMQDRASAYYICVDETVPYAQLPAQLEEVRSLLEAQAVKYKDGGALIYSDPAASSLNELASQAVLFVHDSLDVMHPLQIKKIAAGPVVSASVEANPAIAALKIYPALSGWLSKNKAAYQRTFPMLEIYSPPLFTVQMPVLHQ